MACTVKTYEGKATLFDIFSCLRQEKEAMFLDSSLKNKYGKVSIAGFLPAEVIKEEDGVFTRNGQVQQGDSLSWLKGYLAEHREENPTDLPFLSGGMGYLSYDYGKKLMGLPHVHPKEYALPEVYLVFHRLYVIEEVDTGKITLAARDPEALAWFYEKEQETENWTRQPEISRPSGKVEVTSDFLQEAYEDAIGKMIDYIVAGDIYITNMTRQITLTSDADPYAVFRILRKENPSPFGGYLHTDAGEIVSASPERFFELRNGVIRTRPIKGTRPRGKDPQEDEALRLELENSGKDQSELLMIVDLERNDLSRICKPRSVQLEELFVTEAYATVFHLVSTVRGELRENMDAVDVLRAMFPGGSITGAPKYRAMEIIDELEHSRRGLYTGSMGYLGFDGSCDFNIIIRTLLCRDGQFHLGAGGGITCESDTEFEYEETCQKAVAPIRAVREAAEGGGRA